MAVSVILQCPVCKTKFEMQKEVFDNVIGSVRCIYCDVHLQKIDLVKK